MQVASWLILVFLAYAAAGVGFAAWFVTAGVARLDAAAAAGAPVGFRLLIFPASAALWPLLLCRVLWARRDDGGRLP